MNLARKRTSRLLKTTVPVLALCGLLLPGCSKSNASKSSGDIDVQAAVFSYQFDHNGSLQQKNAKAFYLCIGEERSDPSAELMKRLTGGNPPVRKFSECTATGENGVLDKKTREPGVVLRVVSIKPISATEAEVKGDFFEGLGSAAGSIYNLSKSGGEWQVTNEKMEWQDHSPTKPVKRP